MTQSTTTSWTAKCGGLFGAVILLAVVLGAGFKSAEAHDFWLQPKVFFSQVNHLLHIDAIIGHGKERKLFPHSKEHIKKFAWHLGSQSGDIIAIEGKSPAGFLRPKKSGPCLLSYESTTTDISLMPKKFASYLDEEGLVAMKKLFGALKTKGEKQKERYSRCAKTLIQVGSGKSKIYQKNCGLPLEIMPLQDPTVENKDRKLRFRVLFRGKPLGSMKIAAFSLDPAHMGRKELTWRTDKNGELTIVLPNNGPWALAGVHMSHAPKKNFNWRSYWTSFSFHVGK